MSGWKVLIVNEADRMHLAAETLWLDRLEAMPPKTVIVFTSNYTGKLNQRFCDRCERIKFDSDAARMAGDAGALVDRIWHGETGVATGSELRTRIVREATENGYLSFRRVVQRVRYHLTVS